MNIDIKGWSKEVINRIYAYIDIEKYVKKIYFGHYRVELNLDKPITINEKLQYLKLKKYYNNPIITECVDKCLVKQYICNNKIPCKVAKTIAIYDRVDDISVEDLPEKFVIKCNHGCGYNIICQSKKNENIKEMKDILRRWMREDYWIKYGETQYKYIKKKIMVEELLGDGELLTYKFYCFNGIPKIVYVSSDGEDGEVDKYIDFFDTDWRKMEIGLRGHLHSQRQIDRPNNLEHMVRVSKMLSEKFPFVRVDLYSINDDVYLSELTFIPTGGYMHLTPEGTEVEWGNWLRL